MLSQTVLDEQHFRVIVSLIVLIILLIVLIVLVIVLGIVGWLTLILDCAW